MSRKANGATFQERCQADMAVCLQDFGQHGREPITCEVALRLLQVLAGEAELPPGVDQLQLTGLLKQLVIKVGYARTIESRAKSIQNGGQRPDPSGRDLLKTRRSFYEFSLRWSQMLYRELAMESLLWISSIC